MKNQKLFIRIVCIALVIILCASVGAVAITAFTANAAQVSDETGATGIAKGASGYINTSDVNLRSGAGTNYSVVATMAKNTKFTFVDGKLYNFKWYKIKLTSNSKTGYVSKEYAAVSAAVSTVTGYVKDDYVNLRSGAGTNYSVVDCLRKNTKFTFVSTSLYNNLWYKVKINTTSKTGYLRKDYVVKDSSSSQSAAAQPATQSETKSTSAAINKGYITDDYVNLRSGAGTNYSVVVCMRVNTKFTFVSTSLYNSEWYKIKLDSNGKTGYVKKNFVAKDSSNTSSTQPNTTPKINLTTANSIKLSSSSKTIYVGNKFAITATAAGTVTWSTSNKNVAAVDSHGVVTAKKAGSAKITAKYGKKTAVCKITVKSGSSVKISHNSISLPYKKSVLLKSYTSGVSWSSSNTKIATVKNGVVNAVGKGYVTISASTSYGAATCLIKVTSRESVRFCYASPNSAPLNSSVKFKAITDTDRVGVYFIVSNGSTSYKVAAKSKTKDGSTYIWTGTHKLSKAGKWTVKAYSKYKTESKYYTTAGGGEGQAFVTATTSKTATACAERRASDEVIGVIANYEGFLPSVTADVITSDPTLGYGKVVTSGEQFYNNITKNEAYAYLCQTVNKGGYTTMTNSYLINNGIKFNQQQFDALACFAYNVGGGVFYNDADLQSVLNNTGSSGKIKAGAAGTVTASDVNLRKGAGTNYSVVTCMSRGTKFTFTDGKIYNSDWYKIKLSNGKSGYVHKSYVSASGSSSGSSKDLTYVNKQALINSLLQYHHAAGSCIWGLLYRRIDEVEMFLYGDYNRDGQYNRNNFHFTCYANSGFYI